MDSVGTFDSTKASLQGLLRDIHQGKIQLPDFQRGWVWDDEHVRSLLAPSRTPDGAYDWSRIEAAVAAIPKCRWTFYGYLAELGGTGPVPVGGARMASAPLPLAYRVLDSQGRIRPEFRWHDPADTRDVHEVVAGEGIRFDESGAGDPAQRLPPTDLARLLQLQQTQAR